jgi:adenylylsulfate kinase
LASKFNTLKDEGNNIFSVFDELLQREDKEGLLKQKARVIWLTGLSGSGKTTLAKYLERKLQAEGYLSQVLDGDNIRAGINNNLGFSDEDRIENIRRIAEISKLFLNCGVITINAFVSPTKQVRKLAESIIGSEDFIEVFVDTPLSICESRDVKGLYAKARRGEIKDFTGVSAPFEVSENPTLTIQTGHKTVAESGEELFNFVRSKVTL